MVSIQMFDCTSFVFLLLARKSPSAAFGSQGKRFFAPLRMTKGLGFRAQPAGHARCQPDVCGPPPAKAAARTAQKSRRTTQRHSYRNHCSHPPPHSSERLLLAPAAGVRKRETGVLSSVGTEGDGWSSSSFGGAYPHNAGYLQLVANRVYPQNNAGRSYALTVRCVQHLLRSCFFVHAGFRDGFL